MMSFCRDVLYATWTHSIRTQRPKNWHNRITFASFAARTWSTHRRNCLADIYSIRPVCAHGSSVNKRVRPVAWIFCEATTITMNDRLPMPIWISTITIKQTRPMQMPCHRITTMWMRSITISTTIHVSSIIFNLHIRPAPIEPQSVLVLQWWIRSQTFWLVKRISMHQWCPDSFHSIHSCSRQCHRRHQFHQQQHLPSHRRQQCQTHWINCQKKNSVCWKATSVATLKNASR